MGDAQLIKGILEGCVLSLIAEGETYGYELLTNLAEHGFTEILEGTLYPVLTRLEKNGYIKCRKGKSPYGPIRKYYSVTESGTEYLAGFLENYEKITACADSVLRRGKR